jgi:hypothetical protein
MKNCNIRYILAVVMLMTTSVAVAQEMQSAYFVKDYLFRHDLNPALGNEKNYISFPALGNVNAEIRGNFGIGDVLFDNPMNNGKKKTTFMNPMISVKDALSGFKTGKNILSADIGVTVLSAGFKGMGGYNTIEIGVKGFAGLSLPYEFFEFAKNTGNKKYDLNDMAFRGQMYTEVGLGHSRQINEKLSVGAKAKFLFGVTRADIGVENMRADLSADNQWILSGRANADVSMKGFTYKTKTDTYEAKPGSYEYVDDVDVHGAGVSGVGLAADLGAVYRVNEDLTLSAALTDLGFISWNNDMQATNIANEFVFQGFHDASVVDSDDPASVDNQWDQYADQLTEFVSLKSVGDKGGRTTALATTIRLGGEYVLPSYRNLTFGLLATHRFNGPFSWTEGRVSANVAPLNWLDGGVNVAVHSFGASLGWIVNIHPKHFNLFIGMNHLCGKMSKEFIHLNSKSAFSLGVNYTW